MAVNKLIPFLFVNQLWILKPKKKTNSTFDILRKLCWGTLLGLFITMQMGNIFMDEIKSVISLHPLREQLLMDLLGSSTSATDPVIYIWLAIIPLKYNIENCVFLGINNCIRI